MWSRTRVTETLGTAYPILQGPFGGGLSSVALLAAVSNAGGLGSFGAHALGADAIEALAAEIRTQTAKPFAINLWVKDHDGDGHAPSQAVLDSAYAALEPYFKELGLAKPVYPPSFGQKFETQVAAILRAAPPVFSFVYGVPDAAILQECKRRGIITIGTALTPEEAGVLDEAGVDLIVATGFEAGGHRVAFLRPAEDSLIGTFALIPQTVDRVRAPVIAAGGIADARGVRAAFALGAAGVQIGTAFLACEESNAPVVHRDKLFTAEAAATALTRGFTGRLARGIENRMLRELRAQAAPFAPYPAQSWLTGQLKQAAMQQGRADLISLWCGQSAGLLRHRRAADFLAELVRALDAA